LLSLQGTQNQIDITQNRLSTGKKVNSALDGPQAFFASQALTNRASDLNRLLDSIGQSIQVIKAADNGVTALSKLVEQADSVASSARDALAAGQSEAKVTGNKDLRGINDLSTVTGWSAGASIALQLTKEDGSVRNVEAHGVAPAATRNIAITAGMSTQDLITTINDTVDIDNNPVMNASLDEKGQLVIKTTNGDNFSMRFTTTGNTDSENLGAASALGFGETAKVYTVGAANQVGFSAKADVAIRSFSMVTDATGTVAQRSSLLTSLRNADAPGVNLFSGLDNAADDFTIAINGGARQNIELTDGAASLTVQGFIDQINSNTTLNSKIKASFDETTGQISIAATDPSVTGLEIGYVGDAVATVANFGFGSNALNAADGNPVRENILVGKASAQLANYEKEFNNLREQITQLVSNGDTGYRGTNLLNGNDLLTVFNENRTSNLTTEGVNFTAEGLGISEANFARADTVDAALAEAREALNTIRDFGSTLANDLSIIQARQTFTTELINTLKEGSAKLVDADQNEEGAKLLALQTRQSLGVTALSLASQSQQSILRLF
jgi:flagellin-like hook-associated protein FlgL